MAHKVQTVVGNVTLPGVGLVETAGTIVTLDDDDFQKIPAAAFPGKLIDLGVTTGAVSAQANAVAAPAAMTSAAATGGDAPTEAEYNALRADVVALRTTVANILTELKTAGGPMKSS